MAYELVAEEIEVHPGFSAASFGTSQENSIKRTGIRKVMHRDCQMKRREIVSSHALPPWTIPPFQPL
jgi:hypothetical protein